MVNSIPLRPTDLLGLDQDIEVPNVNRGRAAYPHPLQDQQGNEVPHGRPAAVQVLDRLYHVEWPAGRTTKPSHHIAPEWTILSLGSWLFSPIQSYQTPMGRR